MDTWALGFGLTARQRVSKSNDYLSPKTTSNQHGIARVVPPLNRPCKTPGSPYSATERGGGVTGTSVKVRLYYQPIHYLLST